MKQVPDNPFNPDRPAVADYEFFGRSDAFEKIRHALGNAPATNPEVINGPPGTGKTSLLRRLPDELQDSPTCVLYTDLLEIDATNMSTFLWQLSKSITSALSQQQVEAPSIEKRMLVLNPQLVFRQRFWNPLLTKARTSPLLLAWDNFDSLATTLGGERIVQTLRAFLFELLETDAPVDMLLTITGRVEAIGDAALSPFQLQRSHRLLNLTRDSTLQLIRASGRFDVFQPVAEFIFQLTAGHPGDTQRLCHTLYENQRQFGRRQVTAADVISVLRHELGPGDFVGAVHRRLNEGSAPNRGSSPAGTKP